MVVIGKDDYESLMETMRIYNNPYLRGKIARGLAQARSGRLLPTAPPSAEA